MEAARLLYFRRKIDMSEYIVLIEPGDDTPAKNHCIPGYELISETNIYDELPHNLPYSETMMLVLPMLCRKED